jgi:hypothetical protein
LKSEMDDDVQERIISSNSLNVLIYY